MPNLARFQVVKAWTYRYHRYFAPRRELDGKRCYDLSSECGRYHLRITGEEADRMPLARLRAVGLY